MANFQSASISRKIFPPRPANGMVGAVFDTVDIETAPLVGDTWELVNIPANTVTLGMFYVSGTVDSNGTPTFAFTVGRKIVNADGSVSVNSSVFGTQGASSGLLRYVSFGGFPITGSVQVVQTVLITVTAAPATFAGPVSPGIVLLFTPAITRVPSVGP